MRHCGVVLGLGQVVCQVTDRPGGIENLRMITYKVGAMLLSGFNLLAGLHWWINRVQLGEFDH